MTLSELVAVLDRHRIEPVSLSYAHVRQGVHLTDPILARWTLYVATCDEFATLAAEWRGKRSARQHQREVRTLYADVGERGLLGHCCHTDLPCWGSEPTVQAEDVLDFGGAP